VIAVLPGGGPSKELASANYNICSLPMAYLKNGRINNTLLSQTLTLALNIGITPTRDLGDVVITAGVLATAKPTTGCGGNIPTPRTCRYDINGNFIGYTNDYKYVTLSAAVINAIAGAAPKTVQGLLNLADSALANADGVVGSENGASLSDIASAVDAINNAFDECRIQVTPVACPATNPNLRLTTTTTGTKGQTATAVVPNSNQSVSMSNPKTGISDAFNFTASAYPNPFTNNVRFTIESSVTGHGVLEVYNAMGQKIQTVFDGTVFAGKSQVIPYNVPLQHRTNLTYRLTVNNKTVSGKLLNIR
jgi:hypothetical protein